MLKAWEVEITASLQTQQFMKTDLWLFYLITSLWVEKDAPYHQLEFKVLPVSTDIPGSNSNFRASQTAWLHPRARANTAPQPQQAPK